MKTIESKEGRKYVLTHLLGQGSFGRVYRSTDDFAIKEIRYNPNLIQKINQQSQIMKKMDHPNIVKLYDTFYYNRTLYMVMEYCEWDLSQYLNKYLKTNKVDEKTALDILRQLISGMKYLKEKDLIHRDLKPPNILVKLKPNHVQFKIADFGLARYVQGFESSLLQTFVGTPVYMAPQLLNYQQYTTKSDIWSLGIIFYQLLEGSVPFKGLNNKDLINNMLNFRFNVSPNMSSWCRSLLYRMLVVDQQKRIGYQQLFQLVGAGNQKKIGMFRDNSGSKERPISAKSGKSGKSQKQVIIYPPKNEKEALIYPKNKLMDILTLDLYDYFDEQTIKKILKDKSYKPNPEESRKIKEVLSLYNYQLQGLFITDIPSIKAAFD